MSQGIKGTDELVQRRFAVRSERTGEDERVHLVGEMDLSVVGSVDREMRRAESGDAARIILDLGELEFLDAAGIGLLLQLSSRSKSDSGRLSITRARFPQVQRVIDLTGAGDVLPLID